ncbi:CocE/NonD family hydrolase [Burkholderia lata]|uniref:CocE/NonD family hydrolase n=1 Tax=Burkholderia lata (strain ATCC 17760 / DSM 23089 / LMG 22485 / NCIMB 9086 / R18194 / 383) TaxID=482957 RepID=UPI001452B125|nr:CocE/NonD family hydrolase [Burkholderia lata]VWB87237.1 Cocaine esterase [Burkholderia lata]
MGRQKAIEQMGLLVAICAVLPGCNGGDVHNAESISTVKDGVSCAVESVEMRDGTRLYTEVYTPVTGGKAPTIVIRNPYGISQGDGCFAGLIGPAAVQWVKNGYSVVMQETRGTGKSEGTMNPFFQEQNDGYDAIEWAAKQSWSTGKVGTHVGSYLGAAQWQAATMSPPSLVAISPSVTPADYRDDWVGRNGVFDLQFARGWGLGFVTDAIQYAGKKDKQPQSTIDANVAAWVAALKKNVGWISSLPLNSTWNATARTYAPFVWDWYAHQNYDGYWAAVDVGQHMGNIKVPALISGGWYDLFAEGTIDSYLKFKVNAGSQAARDETMLVMDCCGHGSLSANSTQITWGDKKIDIGQNFPSTLSVKWMNKYTKGDNSVDGEPRVQLTVLVPPDVGTRGDTFVLKTSAFPVPGTRYESLALGSGGKANTSTGDGVLLENSTATGAPDSFSYDPNNPVPTVGGNSAGQALDQSAVEARNDVLVYTGSPLSTSKAVIGKVSLKFWAQTSAVDTDFTAKLVDLHPDGYAHNVVDRIVRAKFRNGSKLPPVSVPPNTPVEYNLDLGYTATLFKRGHRVRLEISSSNFPHYAKNLNTGDSEGSATTVVANQMVFHDTSMPSALTLPVVPGVQP